MEMTLNEYLQKEAFNRRISLTTMSLEMGLSKSMLTRVKKMNRRPKADTYYKMAEYLEVDPMMLYNMKLN